MSDFISYLETTWRAIPSARGVTGFPNDGKPVLWTIITEGKWGSETTPIVVASGLYEWLAKHIVSLHNNSLSAKQ